MRRSSSRFHRSTMPALDRSRRGPHQPRATRLTVCVAVVLAAWSAAGAGAETLLVTASPAGIAVDGQCTLIEAIQAANLDATVNECVHDGGSIFFNDADVITLPAGVTITYTAPFPGTVADPFDGGTATPTVESEITIYGRGSTVQRSLAPGTPDFRLFRAIAASSVPVRLSIYELTIQNGLFLGTNPFRGGAAGIFSNARVELFDVVVRNNRSESSTLAVPSGCAAGFPCDTGLGGALSLAEFLICDSLIENNFSAGIAGGGLSGSNGTIYRSTFRNNEVGIVWNAPDIRHRHGNGGGAHILGGNALVVESVFENNIAHHTAGGLQMGSTNRGRNRIVDSTFSGNFADIQAGGLINDGEHLTAVNVTISGNAVTGTFPNPPLGAGGSGFGGAFSNVHDSLWINSTIVDNTTPGGAAVFNGAVGAGEVRFINSVIANTQGAFAGSITNCQHFAPGSFTSAGGNLVDDATCSLVTASDVQGVIPDLGALAANSGPPVPPATVPRTHLPVVGGNLDELGLGGTCPPGDARGVPRPQDAACDRGAVELASGPVLVAEKTAALQVDADGNGVITHGDTLRYTIRVRNLGAASATNVRVADTVDSGPPQVGLASGLSLVCTGLGPPPAGDSCSAGLGGSFLETLGTINPGAIATLTFDATIADPDDGQVWNQATVTADGGISRLTDDPCCTSSISGDPTHTPVVPTGNRSRIGNFVWRDFDGDGLQDASEPGFPGVTVELRDITGVTVLASTITDSSGVFRFNPVVPPPGPTACIEYRLRFVAPLGYTFSPQVPFSSSIDSDPNPGTGIAPMFGCNDTPEDLSYDAGLVAGSVGDRVWNDLNWNGLQDPGEPGVGGVLVTLLDAAGTTTLASVLSTNFTGAYGFSGLANGTAYRLRFELPGGFVWSPRDALGNTADSTDSDVDPLTAEVSFTQGALPATSIDAGLAPLAAIGDRIFRDDDMDGVLDFPAEGGVGGVTVNLRRVGNPMIIATTISNAHGTYFFTALGAGTYEVEVVLPGGYTFSPRDVGSDDSDSDVDPTPGPTLGRSHVITLAGGTDDRSVDAGLIPQPADLAISKTDGVATAIPGGAVSYTIIADNLLGPSPSGGTVNDTFPASLACTWTCAGSGGGLCTAAGVGNLAEPVTLPVGASVTFTVSCTIDPAATGMLINTATITTGLDPNLANNSATDSDTLVPTADLGVSKDDAVASSIPGQSTSYTIVVSNAGPSTVPGAGFSDTFPVSCVAPTWSSLASGGATGNTPAGAGPISETLTLPPGSNVTYTASCPINPAATGVLTNTAMVTVPAAVTDPGPNPNSATDTNTLTPTADLGVTKTDGVVSVIPGQGTSYTITVNNAGPSSVPGATVTDSFPVACVAPSWTSVAAGGATGNTAASSGPIGDVLTLPPGASVIYTANCPIDPAATGSLVNTATVTPPGSVSDPGPNPNSATDTNSLTPTADLGITKTDGVATAVPGQSVSYTITVTNPGPSAAAGVAVADSFPADCVGPTWTSVAAGGATGNTAAGSGAIADSLTLPPTASVTYTANCPIDPAATGTLANTATLTPPGTLTDPGPNPNSATDSDSLTPTADLGITKTDGVASAVPGQSVSYTITVNNPGPSTSPATAVADVFPAACVAPTWSSVAAGGATGNTAAGSGPIADNVTLPPGSSVTYTASCPVDPAATGTLDNTATVTPPGAVSDPGPNPNSATDSDTLTPTADLAVTKTDGVALVTPGSNTIYTIVVSNAGPSAVTGAAAADTFPAACTSVTWTSATAGGASGNTAAGSGAIADNLTLPAGSSVTYTATCAISPAASGTMTNTATVGAPAGVTDPQPANNSADDVNSFLIADLSITVSDGVATATPGGNVTYTITVANAGPSPVSGAMVNDTFPAACLSLTYTSVAGGGATGNTAAGSGAIADSVSLPVGASITYSALCAIDPAAVGVLTNSAAVAPPATVADPDPANNSATDNTSLAPSANLSITKTVDVAVVRPSGTVVYTITVANSGLSSAPASVVSDLFPAGMVCTWTCAPGGGASCPANGSGDLATSVDLPPAGQVVFTASCTAAPGLLGIVDNTATIAPAPGVTDPSPGDNSATATLRVGISVLEIPTLGGAGIVLLAALLAGLALVVTTRRARRSVTQG